MKSNRFVERHARAETPRRALVTAALACATDHGVDPLARRVIDAMACRSIMD